MWPAAFLYSMIRLPFCLTWIANYILLHTIWRKKIWFLFYVAGFAPTIEFVILCEQYVYCVLQINYRNEL